MAESRGHKPLFTDCLSKSVCAQIPGSSFGEIAAARAQPVAGDNKGRWSKDWPRVICRRAAPGNSAQMIAFVDAVCFDRITKFIEKSVLAVCRTADAASN
jgi:hypothetical protein